MPQRRTLQRWIFSAVALAGAVPLMLAPTMLNWPPAGGGPRIVAETLCALIATVWALGFAALAFRREDEFVQQGTKYAWYWGASGGVVVSAPIYVFVQAGGLHWLDPALPVSLGRAFALGYGLLLVSQLVGSLVVLTWWKATRR